MEFLAEEKGGRSHFSSWGKKAGTLNLSSENSAASKGSFVSRLEFRWMRT